MLKAKGIWSKFTTEQILKVLVDYPDFGHPVANDIWRKSWFWNCDLRKETELQWQLTNIQKWELVYAGQEKFAYFKHVYIMMLILWVSAAHSSAPAEIVETSFSNCFEGGKHTQTRVDKIACS